MCAPVLTAPSACRSLRPCMERTSVMRWTIASKVHLPTVGSCQYADRHCENLVLLWMLPCKQLVLRHRLIFSHHLCLGCGIGRGSVMVLIPRRRILTWHLLRRAHHLPLASPNYAVPHPVFFLPIYSSSITHSATDGCPCLLPHSLSVSQVEHCWLVQSGAVAGLER